MIQSKPYLKFSNSYPPNTLSQYISHPSGSNSAIQLATFNHHRFAFYFWALWKKESNKITIPDLVSFDWHQDLAYPEKQQKNELKELDLNNSFEVSFFSSYRLNPLNDNHILSAAYLDLINDVWVLCKQGLFDSAWEDEFITDYKGKKHTIRKFKNIEKLQTELLLTSIENVFFDIDLDYFTINNNIGFDDKFDYMKDKEIKSILSNDSELIKWIFNRLQGLTIALEPEYTGGITKSFKFLEMISNSWFNGAIGSNDLKWKHLLNDI